MKHLLTATMAAALLVGVSTTAIAQTTTADPATNTGTTAEASSMAPESSYYDQGDIERRLEARGFENVDVELDDQNYTGTADWYGDEVDLTVTASTGRVVEPTKLSSDQVQAKLEDDGYENVSDVQEAGDEFTAKAERFGEEMDLRVNASTGTIVDPRELKKDQIETKLGEDDDYSEIVIFEREGDYGNYYVKAEKDDEIFLLEVNPLSGRIMNEREES